MPAEPVVTRSVPRHPVLRWGAPIVLIAVAAFVAIAHSLATGGAMERFDTVVRSVAADHRTPEQVLLFSRLTHLGDTATLLGLGAFWAVLLLWRRRTSLAGAWLLALCGNSLLNPSLKGYFERVRPVHDAAIVNASGFSFPSGHSSGSLVAYGMLAYLALRTLPPRWRVRAGVPAMLLAGLAALITGVSRVVLQVHYPSDVLAGWASGTAWLTMCIGVAEWARRRGQR
jgi:undecaprenyl-diphosphatase